MHFDEKTRAQVKKQMDLTLRYWLPTHNEVIVTFCTSLFFGHAEANKVVSRMIEQFHEDNIPVDTGSSDVSFAERLKIQISILTLIPLNSLSSVELLIQFNPNLSTLCVVVRST